ncbi:MAG: FKBP-type peptidyl-prolyl cis-trans isomerase [Cyclobacteriaceae bacterium]
MKFLLPLIFLILVSCTPPGSESGTEITGDTIQTASGLRYIYLKRGEGRKVEEGAKLETILSLMVEDSVVWNTYNDPDSLFSFIAGIGQVIKGFDEMALLMREGDNVVAILPDSLAYGDRGAGDVIPPNATLIYNRYEIVSAGEPRKMSSDTLYQLMISDGMEAMKAQFETIIRDTTVYHAWGEYDDFLLVRKVLRDSLYSEAVELANYLGTLHDDPNTLSLMARALERNGMIQQAIDTLRSIMSRYPEDSYDRENFESTIERLENLPEME